MPRAESVSFSSLVHIDECSIFYLMAYEAILYSLLISSIIKNPNFGPIASWVPTAENLRMRSLEENKIIEIKEEITVRQED